MFMASEPELASESPYAPIHSQVASFGRQRCFWSSVPYHTSGRVAMPMCAPKAVEKLASTEMWSVMSVELTLSSAHAAVLLRDIDGGESQFGGLAQQRHHRAGLLGFDGGDAGQNLFARKARRRGRDLALLLVQVFGSKNLGGGAGFKQETAAGSGGDGGCDGRGHGLARPPVTETKEPAS